jgi:hypothetical protein
LTNFSPVSVKHLRVEIKKNVVLKKVKINRQSSDYTPQIFPYQPQMIVEKLLSPDAFLFFPLK